MTDARFGRSNWPPAHLAIEVRTTDASAPQTVRYHAQDRLLIIGQAHLLAPLAAQVPSPWQLTCVASQGLATEIDTEVPRASAPAARPLALQKPVLGGYLGQFSLTGQDSHGQVVDLGALCYPRAPHFDAVLDVSTTPLISALRPPSDIAMRRSLPQPKRR
ncbi:MAG: hypothetical protein ACRCYV_01205 [Aeromonas sp.]